MSKLTQKELSRLINLTQIAVNNLREAQELLVPLNMETENKVAEECEKHVKIQNKLLDMHEDL